LRSEIKKLAAHWKVQHESALQCGEGRAGARIELRAEKVPDVPIASGRDFDRRSAPLPGEGRKVTVAGHVNLTIELNSRSVSARVMLREFNDDGSTKEKVNWTMKITA
jgi:hypothetical protein